MPARPTRSSEACAVQSAVRRAEPWSGASFPPPSAAHWRPAAPAPAFQPLRTSQPIPQVRQEARSRMPEAPPPAAHRRSLPPCGKPPPKPPAPPKPGSETACAISTCITLYRRGAGWYPARPLATGALHIALRGVRLLHQLLDVHPVDRRLAMPVALEVDPLAIRREQRRHRLRIARLVFAHRPLAVPRAQKQQHRRRRVPARPTNTDASRFAPKDSELAGLPDHLIRAAIRREFAQIVQLRPVVREIQVQNRLAVAAPVGRADAARRPVSACDSACRRSSPSTAPRRPAGTASARASDARSAPTSGTAIPPPSEPRPAPASPCAVRDVSPAPFDQRHVRAVRTHAHAAGKLPSFGRLVQFPLLQVGHARRCTPTVPPDNRTSGCRAAA